eukprot:g27862.t1
MEHPGEQGGCDWKFFLWTIRYSDHESDSHQSAHSCDTHCEADDVAKGTPDLDPLDYCDSQIIGMSTGALGSAVVRLCHHIDIPKDQWIPGDVALEFWWGSLGDSVSTLFMSITGGISWQIAENPLFALSGAWKAGRFVRLVQLPSAPFALL